MSGLKGIQNKMTMSLIQHLVYVIASSDQREVSKCLWIVAQSFTEGTNLLGIETYVVTVGQHFLKHQASIIQAARTSKALSQPETSGVKGTLGTAQAIIGSLGMFISIHNVITGQPVFITANKIEYALNNLSGEVGNHQYQVTSMSI